MTKTILITGTSRGIGRAIAIQLLSEGYQVIGLSRTQSIEHDNYTHYQIDLADLSTLPDRLKTLNLTIDGLICNAGIWHYSNFEELSYADIEQMVHLNLLSPLFLVKAFLPQMKQKRSGDIFFLGSESGLKGAPKQSVYSASKSALRAFAQSLRSESATKNIRVTMINPGSVKTDMLEIAPFSLSEDSLHHILPEDIAQLISYLLKARTGTVLDEITLSPQKHRLEKKKETTL
ncbi:MAG: 3-oxoacyl-[acyl-carrier-protein] reductase FabG [Chlamydiae bacterium]|nr:3-oxoacyl-[acyl-carrier-protein] reductase FabG [Chlamydiota bacterium]